jgi:FlaA1/EpsC-like NDP-sugar epimerase
MSRNFLRLALVRAARLCDLAIVSITFLVAFAIASNSLTWLSFSDVLILRIKVVNIVLFGAYLLFCSAVFSMCGLYMSHRLSHWRRQVREVVVAVTLMMTPIVLLQWPMGFEFATTKFVLCYWLATVIILLLARISGRKLLYFLRAQGKNLRTVVVIGRSTEVGALANRLERDTALGYRIVGIIDVKEDYNERVSNN